MANLAFYLLVSFVLALIITPSARWLALRFNVLAQTNHRTVHHGRIPKWGGLAIFLSFSVTVIVLLIKSSFIFSGQAQQIITLLGAGSLIFLLGTLDDKLDLDCNLKLTIELIAAYIAVAAGWRIDELVFSVNEKISLGYLSWPVSILWIVGVANAINLIDGLDGLASGVVIVAAFINFAVAALFHNYLVSVLSVILMGAVLGFLRYNIYPASIFMGDSGSLTLGFFLACLSINGATIAAGQVAIISPLMLLAIPITDTILAIIRRIRRGIHPFHADQEHIHHRLVRLGLSQSGAALFIVGLSFIFGVLAFLFAQGIHTNLNLFSSFAGF